MLVKMLEHIVGTRDGKRWPPRGGVIDLPDDEAHALLAHGYAQPVPISRMPAFAPTEPAEASIVEEARESATLKRTKRGKAAK